MKKPKTKRPIKCFEAENDVLEMLDRAKNAELTVGEIINRAVREHGPKVIQQIIKERQQTLASFPPALEQPQELLAA